MYFRLSGNVTEVMLSLAEKALELIPTTVYSLPSTSIFDGIVTSP